MCLLNKLFDWFKNTQTRENQAKEERIRTALKNIERDSPGTFAILSDLLGVGYLIDIIPADIPDKTLGRTTITAYKSNVEIDLFKVDRVRDSLECVIAHELFHIKRAYDMGFAKYIQLVEDSKGQGWWAKEYEYNVIEDENKFRAEMIKTGRYPGMALTRQIQNSRNPL